MSTPRFIRLAFGTVRVAPMRHGAVAFEVTGPDGFADHALTLDEALELEEALRAARQAASLAAAEKAAPPLVANDHVPDWRSDLGWSVSPNVIEQ